MTLLYNSTTENKMLASYRVALSVFFTLNKYCVKASARYWRESMLILLESVQTVDIVKWIK